MWVAQDADVQQVDVDSAQRVLVEALNRPGGAELVFGTLAGLPGVEHEPGRPGRWLRAATPATLRVGGWTFAPTGTGSALEVQHTVRGVVLARLVASPAQAAARLAPAVLTAAEEAGREAEDVTAAALGALAEVLAL